MVLITRRAFVGGASGVSLAAAVSAQDGAAPVEVARSEEFSEGPVFDYEGNLYVAHLGTSTVKVLAPDGSPLTSLRAGNYDASNLVFGGKNLDELYVTGSTGHRSNTPGRVYRLRLSGAKGVSSLLPR